MRGYIDKYFIEGNKMFQYLPYDLQLEILYWLFRNNRKTIQLFTEISYSAYFQLTGDEYLTYIVKYNRYYCNTLTGVCMRINILSK
jgi:hypothetical protein